MRRAVESLPDIGTNSMVQPVNRTVHVCGPYSPVAGRTDQMLDYKTCRQIASFNRTRKANGCMPSAQGLTEI